MTGRTARIPTSSRTLLLLIAASTVLTGVHSPAQTTESPKLSTYEVSTVRLNKTSEQNGKFSYSPAGLTVENMGLESLIEVSFEIEEEQVIGVPAWAKSDRYNIEAKVDPSQTEALKKLTMAQRNHMIRPLLEGRFQLKWHYETRELPIYALVITKNGSKLKDTPVTGTDEDKKHHSFNMGWDSLTSEGISLDQLAHLLTTPLGRPVINQTGLTANYNINMKWTPDDSSHTDTSGPSIFTAIQEQLGLKLEPA
jgi:uncharacterized protein (TIGR03435 family)